MKIAVDLDDVLCSFIAEFLKWYNLQHNTNWQFKDVVDYHWPNFMHTTLEQAIEDVHKFHISQGFADLPLIPGAKEWVDQLVAKHELYLVTSRQNATKEITYTWLDRNFPGVFRKVMFANHYSADGSPALTKGELCKEIGCELIVDDDDRHIGSLLTHDIKVVLIDKPWNRNDELPEGVIRAYNWEGVTQAIEKLLTKSITIN